MKEEAFKVNDIVTAIIPGLNPDGVMIKIDDVQKWSDGVMHYGGQYKALGTGLTAYNRGVQFTGDQATLIPVKEKVKPDTKPESKEKQKS